MPRLLESVTATGVHVPAGSADGALIRCSAPAPPVVIANRAVPAELCGVRNMEAWVPDPRSKIRDQALTVFSRTHIATVKLPIPSRIPFGSRTCPSEPLRATALPARPAVHEVPPASVAVLPLPVASAAVVPAVSSNRYQATKAGGGAALTFQ